MASLWQYTERCCCSAQATNHLFSRNSVPALCGTRSRHGPRLGQRPFLSGVAYPSDPFVCPPRNLELFSGRPAQFFARGSLVVLNAEAGATGPGEKPERRRVDEDKTEEEEWPQEASSLPRGALSDLASLRAALVQLNASVVGVISALDSLALTSQGESSAEPSQGLTGGSLRGAQVLLSSATGLAPGLGPELPLLEAQPMATQSGYGTARAAPSPTAAVITPASPPPAATVPGVPSQLAVRLLQAFVQARVEGMGRPEEVALEDFVEVCIAAEAQGLSLQELQLQLILAEGALPPPFGKGGMDLLPGDGEGQREGSGASASASPRAAVEAEDLRIRTLWVRFVYTTLIMVRRMAEGLGYLDIVSPEELGPSDPMDAYVQAILRSAVEEGKDLAHTLALQRTAAPVTSTSMRMMRQNQLLILMAFEKGLARG